MATAMRPFRLVVIGLAFLHLLAYAAAEDILVVHSRSFVATSVLPNDATSTSTIAPRRVDVPAVEREDATAPATATTTAAAGPPTCSSSCPCICLVVHMREFAVEDTVPAPSGITIASATMKKALPLLVVPFLPSPLAALVVLSSLAPHARAADDSCGLLAHATCAVYRYHPNADGGTGCVDRSRPLDGVRPVACGPRQGRIDGAFRRYCHVRTVEFYDGPEGVEWRVLADHPRVADPDAVVAAGGDVCYVELEHLNNREGYFIRCPVRKCPRFPFLCCSDSPHDAIVWERRKLTYRGAVVWDKYSNNTASDAQA
ncbi:hypothetical protein QOZ80_8AG0626790 [Eleusine coracana subsp. coracana]|nr:hypothetical protein QOZ80_8AG0626790 [Eleusine coracana subsp. coracana]